MEFFSLKYRQLSFLLIYFPSLQFFFKFALVSRSIKNCAAVSIVKTIAWRLVSSHEKSRRTTKDSQCAHETAVLENWELGVQDYSDPLSGNPKNGFR